MPKGVHEMCIHPADTESAVDDDGAADSFARGLQQQAAAVGHVGNLLDGGDVVGVLLQVAEFSDRKMG